MAVKSLSQVSVEESFHNFMDLKQLFPDSQNIKIVVCGKGGTGKSSLINTILGQEVFKADGPGEGSNFTFNTETSGVTVSVQNVTIEIYETPSFQEITASEGGERPIDDLYKKCQHPDLVIYCVDIKETRWFVQDVKETRLLTEKFGVTFWENSLLVFTKANILTQMNQENDNEKTFCKRTYDNFVQIVQEQLIEQGVSSSVTNNIPAVLAGSERDKYLPYVSKTVSDTCNEGYQDFLPELWLTCFEQISGKPRNVFLKVTDYSKTVELSKDNLTRAQKQLTSEIEEQFKEKEQQLKEKELQLNSQIQQLQS